MKKHPKPILLFLCLASVGCLCGQSKAYEMFAPDTTLHVAFFEGYKIDSVTRIDVTIISTKDTAAWERLVKDLNLNIVDPNSRLLVKMARIDDPRQRTPFVEGQCDVLLSIPKTMSVCIYHKPTSRMWDILLKKQFEESLKDKYK